MISQEVRAAMDAGALMAHLAKYLDGQCWDGERQRKALTCMARFILTGESINERQ